MAATPINDAFEDKIASFQAITGISDHGLATSILAAHSWDLNLAVSTFLDALDGDLPLPLSPRSNANSSALTAAPASPGIISRFANLPPSAISGGLGLVSDTISFSSGLAAAVVSRSLHLLHLGPQPTAAGSGVHRPRIFPHWLPPDAEAAGFVDAFEQEYGRTRPDFAPVGFTSALWGARRENRAIFMYIHSPDHPDTPAFCSSCLCSPMVAEFVNENFVAWGGSIRGAEGFRLGDHFQALRFPYCAVVVSQSEGQLLVFQKIEGFKSREEMLNILQRVVEENTLFLAASRLAAEERRNNSRLREEQDAAHSAALEADGAGEHKTKEEQIWAEREAAETLRKLKEEAYVWEKEAQEDVEKEAGNFRKRQEKAVSLGAEPEKGPEVTRVLVRFPSGERKERRFRSSETIKSLYDFVDSLDCLSTEKYTLVSNFPRVCFGPEKHSWSLKEADLHPQASLFVEMVN